MLGLKKMRVVLSRVLSLGLLLSVVRCAHPDGPLPPFRLARPNPIVAENARPGDPTWRSGLVAAAGEVELFASTDSAEAGMDVGVKVSVRGAPQAITARVYRLGHYGGAGARLVWSGGPFEARQQADCPRSAATGRVECAWDETFRFRVGDDWVSGLYLVKVERADGYKRFTPLVVRDYRAAEVLFQPAVLTYQAYNAWGGTNLYSDATGTLPAGRAFEVSFERPYNEDEGAGQMLRWELPFAQWLEREGYDVTYATNVDFLRFPRLLEGIGVFVHAGHDEYWPSQERMQLDAALAKGTTSLAHFGANSAYWRVRMLPGSSGAELRTVVCYKGMVSDPVPGSTVRFRDPPNVQPEDRLFGAMYDGWQFIPYPLVVTRPEHWLFEGTGLTRGDTLPGLVGYEFDRVMPGGPPVDISMDSPVLTVQGVPNRSHVVDRMLPGGTLVFSSGTIYWSLALSQATPDRYDARVVRMTENVLERALAHRRPPRALPVLGPEVARPPTIDARWASAVEAVAGAGGEGGFVDGPGARAQFDGPTGLAADRDGRIFVSDTSNHAIRMIDTDVLHTVTTIAGTGVAGSVDGPGTTAQFRRPTGVAVGPDGAVYVADSDNFAIRRLTRDAAGTWTVTTWAGALGQAGTANGVGTSARFRRPMALAVDDAGNVFVADQAGQTIRMVTAGTQEVVTVAGSGVAGTVDASGVNARFNSPAALALDPDGSLYVFDAAIQLLRKVGPAPARDVRTLAGVPQKAVGYADGAGDTVRFLAQLGMARSADGGLYLADAGNYRLRLVVPGTDRANTRVYTVAGSGRAGQRLGGGADADLVTPAGVALLPGFPTAMVVSDPFNNVIRRVVP